MLKGGKKKSRILHPAELFVKNEGEIKSFPDKQNLRDLVITDLVITRPVLQKILK